MLNPSKQVEKRLLFAVMLCLVLLFIAACGRERATPTPGPTPTLVVAPTPVPIQLINLVDTNLLAATEVRVNCDHSESAQFECSDNNDSIVMDIEIDAANFARWSLQWDASKQPLTGNEVISLHFTREGDIAPNLYLEEENGERRFLSLARYALRAGEQTLHIPLLDFKDEADAYPDFAAIREIQLAFEWADMAGQLILHQLSLETVWQEKVAISDEALSTALSLTVPSGFVIEPIAEGLPEMTQIVFTPQGDMLVSRQLGQIWWHEDVDGDGAYDQRHLYATGFTEIVGLLYDPADGAVWVGGRGQLFRTVDSDGDGVADQREVRIDGLPWGRHQNNGLAWNPDPDPFTGEAGGNWIYFGLGSTDDLVDGGDMNSTVLRFPRDGQGQEDVEVVSRGNRNAYMVVWADLPVDPEDPDGETQWELFASENGPDFNDAPDEVNHIRWQHHYGFPEQFGMVADAAQEGDPYSSPLYPVTAHASASGLGYINNPAWPPEYRTLYVALFGQVFGAEVAGHRVDRIILSQEMTSSGKIYWGTPIPFIEGMDRPLPMATGPNGNLIVGDYAEGIVYQVRAE